MPEVYVAAGSNVAPERHLACAARELAREFPGVRFSPWYRNRAADAPGADFINLAAGFSTALPVREVQARLRAIESAAAAAYASARTAQPPPAGARSGSPAVR